MNRQRLLALNIMRLRQRDGLSQKELATLAGVGERTIQRLENEEVRNPRSDQLEKIAAALKVGRISLEMAPIESNITNVTEDGATLAGVKFRKPKAKKPRSAKDMILTHMAGLQSVVASLPFEDQQLGLAWLKAVLSENAKDIAYIEAQLDRELGPAERAQIAAASKRIALTISQLKKG
jgi:transcriptional regulator with XRE-family HTH domain